MTLDLTAVLGIVIAALGGAAVGLEREWSGHASGPQARFAGIRTFTLLGLLSGLAGWMWAGGQHLVAAMLIAGSLVLVVAAYVAASRVEVDGTTEVAALVVIAAGVLAGLGQMTIASAVIAVTSFLLVEKSQLHSLVKKMDDASLRAGFRFAVMAVVILPLLPRGPYGPWGGVRPRELWLLVLFFSGLSFAGYLTRRAVGSRHGYPLAGMIGGIISSTSVTLTFARTSRNETASATALAIGAIGASAVMYGRVLIATAVLNLEVARLLFPYLVAPMLVAALAAWWGIRTCDEPSAAEKPAENPLQFRSALQMAALFQAVLFAVYWARTIWGEAGIYASAGILGLTDADALVISMARQAAAQIAPEVAARAIAIGVLVNTMLKLVLGMALGQKQFRRIAGLGLSAVGIASVLALWMAR